MLKSINGRTVDEFVWKVDAFVLDHCFNRKITNEGEIIYWRECIGGDNGYIVLYPDGEHLHTYHNPDNW